MLRPTPPERPSRILALLATTAAAVVLAACGDARSPAERRAELVGELADDLVAESDGALGAPEAACVAEGLVDAIGVDRFAVLVETGALVEAEPPVGDEAGGDEADGLQETVVDVFASCDALDAVLDADLDG